MHTHTHTKKKQQELRKSEELEKEAMGDLSKFNNNFRKFKKNPFPYCKNRYQRSGDYGGRDNFWMILMDILMMMIMSRKNNKY